MIEELGVIDTRKIIAAVQESHAVDLRNDSLTALRYRLANTINALQVKTIEEACIKLKNPTFFDEFLFYLTVDTTEFFRDPSFWRELRKLIFPKIQQQPRYNILFPDSSSGEELYSLMIFLEEEGLIDKVNIYASQFSNLKNKFIQDGSYNHSREDINSANYTRAKGKLEFGNYITTAGKKFTIRQDLLENVRFSTHKSILDIKEGEFDLIIYRNSLIYYNKSHQNDIVEHLCSKLKSQGYLAIGVKECLNILSPETKFREIIRNESIYQKIAR